MITFRWHLTAKPNLSLVNDLFFFFFFFLDLESNFGTMAPIDPKLP